MRGLGKSVQGMKDQPARYAMRWAIHVLLPTIAVMLWNRRDDETWKEYLQLPSYRRDFFWNLKVGDSWSVGRRWERPDWSEDGSASAVAYEQVSAPARTFSCYPVEGDVSTTNRLYIQRRQSARWHCPEIEWIAKEVAGTRSFNPGNPAANGTLTETPELFKFTPGS
jgi:hypothetical protein